MQGKEASEQETKVQSNVGIDISKCWLDAHVLPGDERLHVANNCAGIRQLPRDSVWSRMIGWMESV
jgi:transposase